MASNKFGEFGVLDSTRWAPTGIEVYDYPASPLIIQVKPSTVDCRPNHRRRYLAQNCTTAQRVGRRVGGGQNKQQHSGNNRNRRRGFHNTYVFYRLMQEGLLNSKSVNEENAQLGLFNAGVGS